MIMRLLFGYKITQCLYVAAKLNVADHLLDEAKNIEELAILSDSNPDALYRVMRCLASVGVFKEQSDKIFSLNTNARELISSSQSVKDFVILCGEELYQSAGELLYSVKNGLPAFDHIYGMDHWSYLNKNSLKAKIFNDAMQKGSGKVIKQILNSYDFSSYKNIIDVGGGKGHILCNILLNHPNTNGIVFDLPHAEVGASELINDHMLSSRCKFICGDFLNKVPEAADLYILKVVLHDWDDQNALTILKNCRASISSNGKIVIIERIIEETEYKELACLGDINMLVTLTGRERSLSEYNDLLEKSNFKIIKKIDTGTTLSIIEASPI